MRAGSFEVETTEVTTVLKWHWRVRGYKLSRLPSSESGKSFQPGLEAPFQPSSRRSQGEDCATQRSLLIDLPVELILAICRFISSEGDLYRAALTCRRILHVTDPLLYRLNGSKGGETAALLWAARRGSESTARKAITYQATMNPRCISDPVIDAHDRRGNSPLHLAAGRGHIGIVVLLVQAGANLEMKNNDGMTPLHSAAHYGSEAAVLCLLNQGADLEANDPRGRTPLQVATDHGPDEAIDLGDATNRRRERVVRLLLERGANDQVRDGEGFTMLHTAAKAANPYIVSLLLQRGAELEAKDSWGRTPLHMAFCGRSKLVIRRLLDSGADLAIVDDMQMTPVDYADDLWDNLWTGS